MESLIALAKALPPWMLLGIGVFAGWFKSFWSTIYDHTAGYAVRKMHVSLTIEDNEHSQAYRWLTLWAERRLREKRISAMLLRRRKDGVEAAEQDYELIPDYGTYYVRWRKRYLMILTHAKSSTNSGEEARSSDNSSRSIHSFTVSIWGTLNRESLLDVLLEAKDLYAQEHPQTLYYYTNASYSDSWEANLLQRRGLDTIYLPENQLEQIMGDFQRFFDTKHKYRALGIPWRRGWLFYGPPGTGKSSLVQVLSSHFEVPIHYLSLTCIASARELMRLFEYSETPAIILIEDADCLEVAQKRDKEETKKGLSMVVLSDLLNVLDGLVASEGRLVIMTTNHREKLDAALLRAGRIDREFHLDFADEAEIMRFYTKAAKVFDLPPWSEFRGLLRHPYTIADAQAVVFDLQKGETMPVCV